MKQKILGVMFIIIMCFIFLIPNQSLGKISTSDYTIQSYNINMIVNEDNTFDITEDITAYFNVEKHGIYRKIPLKNTITRTDGTKSNNRAKITDISVNEKYTTSNEIGYKVIKIGKSDQTLTGKHSYTIKYKYDIGKDPLKNADELYFNLIGDQWDTSISNVSFTITMPKSFDKSLLGFSSGNVGSTDSSNVTYSVNGNTISGNTIKTLKAGQALTVRLTLPEGYFVGARSNIDVFSICVIILCAVFVLIAYILWAKYGKDEQLVETVEFYPPEGHNSAEVGFLYNGSANTKEIISLLIYLANQGYLKIEKTEKKGLLSKSEGFRITKIKEYAGDNECERLFFDGLFKHSIERKKDVIKATEIMKEAKNEGKKISLQDAFEMLEDNDDKNISVTVSDLKDNFYKTVDKIKSKMNSKENKEKIFEPSSINKVRYLILMIITVFILTSLKPVIDFGEDFLFAILCSRIRIYSNNKDVYGYSR